jgi:hypothetical protein
VDPLTRSIAEFASTSTFGELREEVAYVATRYYERQGSGALQDSQFPTAP